jgi:hypothetical protein
MMLELLPALIIVSGLIGTCCLYARTFREMDRVAADPGGPVVLTRHERTTISELERQLARTATGADKQRSDVSPA